VKKLIKLLCSLLQDKYFYFAQYIAFIQATIHYARLWGSNLWWEVVGPDLLFIVIIEPGMWKRLNFCGCGSTLKKEAGSESELGSI